MCITESIHHFEAVRAAHYLAQKQLPRIEIYKALVDDLGVAPHTALDVALAA